MSCIWISFTLFSNCELNWMRSRKGRKKTNTHCSMKSFGGKVSVFCMMWLWNDPAAAVKFHYPISRDTLSNPRLWLPFTLADDLKCFKDPIFCRLMSIWTASLLCKTGGGLAEQTFDVGADLSQTKNKNACFFPHCWYVLLCKGWTPTPPPTILYNRNHQDNLINNSRTGSPHRYHPTFQHAALLPLWAETRPPAHGVPSQHLLRRWWHTRAGMKKNLALGDTPAHGRLPLQKFGRVKRRDGGVPQGCCTDACNHITAIDTHQTPLM